MVVSLNSRLESNKEEEEKKDYESLRLDGRAALDDRGVERGVLLHPRVSFDQFGHLRDILDELSPRPCQHLLLLCAVWTAHPTWWGVWQWQGGSGSQEEE